GGRAAGVASGRSGAAGGAAGPGHLRRAARAAAGAQARRGTGSVAVRRRHPGHAGRRLHVDDRKPAGPAVHLRGEHRPRLLRLRGGRGDRRGSRELAPAHHSNEERAVTWLEATSIAFIVLGIGWTVWR